MKREFFFIAKLDGPKFATQSRRENACRILGESLIREAGSLLVGEVKLHHSEIGNEARVSVYCSFEGVESEYLSRMKSYLKEVVQAIDVMQPDILDSAPRPSDDQKHKMQILPENELMLIQDAQSSVYALSRSATLAGSLHGLFQESDRRRHLDEGTSETPLARFFGCS